MFVKLNKKIREFLALFPGELSIFVERTVATPCYFLKGQKIKNIFPRLTACKKVTSIGDFCRIMSKYKIHCRNLSRANSHHYP